MRPGMASELLRELAPLLAEEGIDVDNIDVPDVDTLQQAMNRAIERQNMVRFTPVGQARELAAATLRLAARQSLTVTPGWPPRSWTRPSRSPPTDPPPPSPAASAWPSACLTSGCRDTIAASPLISGS
jgi:hypothetical protein